MVARFSKPILSLLLALAVMLVATAQTGPRTGQWAHEGSSLQPDPRVTWGRLDNGLRYALVPHDAVPGRVTLRLIVLAGSLDETARERGIAHFIEHMAFRGTATFRYEDMISFFQKLGMEYGSDVNATTSYDHTAFMLDYRDATPELLRDGLHLYREMAESVAFDPAGIDQERPVILSELRLRDSMTARSQQASFPVLFEGLQFAGRAPGGVPETIEAFTREDFLNFYRRNYRPDLMVLVAAGDFTAPKLEALIKEQLGPLKRPNQPILERNVGQIPSRKELRAGVYRITDVSTASVMAASVIPKATAPDSYESWLERERRNFALGLVSGRLPTAVPQAVGGSASYESLFGFDAAIIELQTPMDYWSDTLTAADQLTRATAAQGFDRREIEAVKTRTLAYGNHILEQYATIDPAALCEELSESIISHHVYVGPEVEFQWLTAWLDHIDLKALQQSFKDVWDFDRTAYFLAGDVGPELKAGDVLRPIEQSRRGRVRSFRPDLHQGATAEVPKFSSKAEVEETGTVPEFDAQLFALSNNVHLNFVSNRQEPGLVRAVVRVGNGLLDMPGDEPALKEFGLQTLMSSGTTHFSTEQFYNTVQEAFLTFSLDVADYDAFAFRVTTGTENLEMFLAIVTDFLTRPRFDTNVHRSEKARAAMGRMSSTLGMQEGMRQLTDHLFKGDARFAYGTFNDYLGMSSIDVRDWLEEPLMTGYVEATIVGDIDQAQLLELVKRTLGSLPQRAADKAMLLSPKPVKIAAYPGFKRIEFVGEQHLGLVVGTWPVEGKLTVRDTAALYVLAKILEIRIRDEIRGHLGLAYSPTAGYSSYDGFPAFGVLQATIDCAPTEATRIARLVEEIGVKISVEGTSEGEFEGSRGILASQVRRAFYDNEFLVSVLKRAQEDPADLQEAIEVHRGMIDTITKEEVDTWAQKLLRADNSRTAAIVPKPFVGLFQTN